MDHQINEIQEAMILPLTRKSQFEKLNILPSKGVLMNGPSGTSKTLIARACAAETNATFLKLSATQLSQHFIGEGAKLMREAFALAKEKAPTIIICLGSAITESNPMAATSVLTEQQPKHRCCNLLNLMP